MKIGKLGTTGCYVGVINLGTLCYLRRCSDSDCLDCIFWRGYSDITLSWECMWCGYLIREGFIFRERGICA